jgi:hypothetical protein
LEREGGREGGREDSNGDLKTGKMNDKKQKATKRKNMG